MRNSNIRILVVLSVITLMGIIITQVYWVNRAIAQQDQVFDHNVQVALRSVVESLCESSGKDFPTENPIEQVSTNYFIVRTNDQIDIRTLEYLITGEIRKRSITEDFEYGVYDCQNDQMVYADNINVVSLEHKDFFPELKDEEYYFGIYFPGKSKALADQLGFWKFTTVLTLIVALFFTYALFIILRQKRLSEIQRDFVNNITHELKTPLATLSLASNTLQDKVPEKGKKYAEIIQQETARLQGHVEKILKGSFLEKQVALKLEMTDLSTFITHITDRFRQQYQRHMIQWEVEVAYLIVNIDKNLLDNILSNIVDNAVKYGASTITIAGKELDSKGVALAINDDGIGMTKNHMKHIFNRFYRIPDVDEQHNVKGFGLGLYIVRQSVKKLKGKISVKSIPGKGSEFTITLPHG